MPLSQFVEPIESSSSSFKAYRMDSTVRTPDMRRAAKLGTCECCDYVTVSNDQQSVILIEETNLASTITDFKQKYDYLNDDDQTDLLYDEILKENRLKMYGSIGLVPPVKLAGRCESVSAREQVSILARGGRNFVGFCYADGLPDRQVEKFSKKSTD